MSRRRFEHKLEEFHRALMDKGYAVNSCRTMTLGLIQLFNYFDMDMKTRVISAEAKKTVETEKSYPLTIEEVRQIETVAEFDLLPYDANYTLKVDENGDGEFDYELTPEIETMTTEYDIGITEIVPSKTFVGQGYNLSLNITIMNYGAHTETFNIIAYANTTTIATQPLL